MPERKDQIGKQEVRRGSFLLSLSPKRPGVGVDENQHRQRAMTPMTKSMSRMTKVKKGTGKMDAAMMIAEAKRMNREMLSAEFKGPGDTIEAAAQRQQTKWGVPVPTALRLWNREVTDMLVSSFAPVFHAYLEFKDRAETAAERMERKYEEERARTVDSRLRRLADAVAAWEEKT
jgi:hypothetical protein